MKGFNERITNSSKSSTNESTQSSRSRSAQIVSERYSQRDRVKAKMMENERKKRINHQKAKSDKLFLWQQKTKRSPFCVDLVAENERSDEERRIRQRDESARLKTLEKKRLYAKNSIVIKALGEESDLQALREEKRLIQTEEKRLRALLDLEKTNSSSKSDLMAAKNAEKARNRVKSEHHRKTKRQETENQRAKYQELLKDKLGLK